MTTKKSQRFATPWATKTCHLTFVHIFTKHSSIFKILEWHTLWTICNNKVIIKYLTTRSQRRYTTLWNRKQTFCWMNNETSGQHRGE